MRILEELGQKGVVATRLVADSRSVQPGDVFVAVPGARTDGRAFIAQAMANGAAAVIAEAGKELDTGALPMIEVEGLAMLSGELAHLVHGRPSAHLWLAGVTGTNGKTSVSQWIAQAMNALPYLPPGRPKADTANDMESRSDEPLSPLSAGKGMGERFHKSYLPPGRPKADTANDMESRSDEPLSPLSAGKGMGERFHKCAVIGTLGNGLLDALDASPNTTPDAITLHAALAGFLARGADACAMEVSSIGLDQGRVNGAAIDVAVFTNLTRDHLDYHGTMTAYAAAKEKLFLRPGLRAAVLNLDDALGRELALKLKARVATIGYSLEGATQVTDEILHAGHIRMSATGVDFEVDGVSFSAPVVGRFNVSNLLAVTGALRARGESLVDIASALRRVQPPPGRMQAVGGENEPLVIVDYAHTPDALEQVLGVLRETAAARGGKLICVFGCGGERDPGKRPAMGATAERLADVVVLTSDNPRGEDPRAIIDAILGGLRRPPRIQSERGLAIAGAVNEADSRDVVLIAGKGHEPYQEIAGVRHPFSDFDAAKSALAGRQP